MHLVHTANGLRIFIFEYFSGFFKFLIFFENFAVYFFLLFILPSWCLVCVFFPNPPNFFRRLYRGIRKMGYQNPHTTKNTSLQLKLFLGGLTHLRFIVHLCFLLCRCTMFHFLNPGFETHPFDHLPRRPSSLGSEPGPMSFSTCAPFSRSLKPRVFILKAMNVSRKSRENHKPIVLAAGNRCSGQNIAFGEVSIRNGTSMEHLAQVNVHSPKCTP